MSIEEELPRLLDELADDHIVGPPPTLEQHAVQATPRNRARPALLPAVAAAVCTVVLIGGLVAIGTRDNDPAPAGPAKSASPITDESQADWPVVSTPPSDPAVVPNIAGGVDGPVMFVPGPPTDGGEDALIEGVLVRDGDCLFVGDGAPGARFAVLWPFGTSWDEDAQEVVTANGTRIPLGSTLSAGGGFGSPEMLQRLLDDDDLQRRADACAEGEFRELAHVQHSISTSVAATSEAPEELEPLHQQAPALGLSVDNVLLVELSLGFEQWNDERAEPAEPEPRVGVVVAAGSDLTLEGRHPGDATVTLFRLDESLRFVEDETLTWNGTDVTIPSPAVGTWFVDVRAVFGPSAGYEGNGVLRSGAWLHVTPPDAPCDAPSTTSTFSPDSQVTGVVDHDGCPVVAADATLELGALTPWFHCAPWPPVLQWGTGGDGTMTRFWQYVYDPSEIVNTTAPDDAITTGRFITAGEILTSASNPDAIYIQTTNSSVQRWTAPDVEIGCI